MKKLYFLFLCIFSAFTLSGCGGGGDGQPAPANNGNPPTVTLIQPENGATGLSRSLTIQLSFSEPVLGVGPDSVSLHANSADSPPIPIGTISLGNQNTYTFSPTSELASNTKYFIVLTDGITNTSKTAALALTTFSFTTGDLANPTVAMARPVNGETNVSKSPSIRLQFSKPVFNVDSANVSLRSGSATGDVVPISTIVGGSNNTYTFSPTSDLNENTLYYVVLGNGITDQNNKPLTGTTNFSFKTGNFIQLTATMISPINNSSDKISLNPIIQIQFSKAALNVTPDNVKLYVGNPQTSQTALISSITTGGNNSYTFGTETLQSNTTYTLVLSDNITDAYGNHLGETSFTFTTGDFVAPEATISNPLNNSTDVSQRPNIVLQFSKAVSGVDTTSITLHEDSPTGAPVDLNSTVTTIPNNGYILTPAEDLKSNTTYYVVVSSSIKDLANNSLVQTFFSFTTGDLSIPVATLASPSDNATGVQTKPDIQLQFSLPVTGLDATTATLRPESPTGTPVTLNITANPDQKSYTLTPTANLQDNTLYYLVLNNGIKGTNNVNIAPTQFSFSVSAHILYMSGYYTVNRINYGIVSRCTIGADGMLNNCRDAGVNDTTGQIVGIFVNSSKNRAYNLDSTRGIIKCDIGVTGTFNSCTTLPYPVLKTSVRMILNQAGTTAYFTNRTIASGVLSCPVNPDGTFGACSTTTLPSSSVYGSLALALSPNEQFLYVATTNNSFSDQNLNTVFKCAIAPDGTIASCGASGGFFNFPGSSFPYGMTLYGPAQNNTVSLYVTKNQLFNGPQPTITQCTISNSTGDLENCVDGPSPAITMDMILHTLSNNQPVAYILGSSSYVFKCDISQADGAFSSSNCVLAGFGGTQAAGGLGLLTH